MIINQEQSTVFGNVNDSAQFSIKSSPKAFQILSSNLYSNKIRAIIREYSCNALDAHRYAKCEDKPFKVLLPSALDLNFVVRDFGNGLSPEEITQLFTTYFSSSKDTSNDFTGALGLGSKSAFSYTSTFSCKSFYKGTCYLYSLYLDGGTPKVQLMDSFKSNDPSGVEISIPVNIKDIHLFVKEAGYVYSAFDVIPEINENIIINKKELIPGVYVFPDSLGRHKYIARMGNVFYPIDTSICNSILIDRIGLFYEFQMNKSDISFVIDFSIGDLDIAPSREQLSYDENTIKVINEKFDYLRNTSFQEFFNKYNDKLKNSSSWFEYQDNLEKIVKDILDCQYKVKIDNILKNIDIKINDKTFTEFTWIIKKYFNNGNLYKSREWKIATDGTTRYQEEPLNFRLSSLGFRPDTGYKLIKLTSPKTVSNITEDANRTDNVIKVITEDHNRDDNLIVIFVDEYKGYKASMFNWFYNNYNKSGKKVVSIIPHNDLHKQHLKSYFKEKYEGSKNFEVFEFSDLIERVKEYKKNNTESKGKKVKETVAFIEKLNNNTFNSSKSIKSQVEAIGFESIKDFRNFLEENPDAVFFQRGDSCIFGYDSQGTPDVALSTETFDDFIKIIDKEVYFYDKSFRWKRNIPDNHTVKVKKSLFGNQFTKYEDSDIIDVLLYLGIISSNDSYTFQFTKGVRNICCHLELSEKQKVILDEMIEYIHRLFILKGIGGLGKIKENLQEYELSKALDKIRWWEQDFIQTFSKNDYYSLSKGLSNRFNQLLEKIPELKFLKDIIGNYSKNTSSNYEFISVSVENRWDDKENKIHFEKFKKFMIKNKNLLNK